MRERPTNRKRSLLNLLVLLLMVSAMYVGAYFAVVTPVRRPGWIPVVSGWKAYYVGETHPEYCSDDGANRFLTTFFQPIHRLDIRWRKSLWEHPEVRVVPLLK